MLKFKSKVLIIIITTLMIVALFQVNSNASSNSNSISITPGGIATTAPATLPPQTTAPTVPPTTPPASQTKLPQTGIEDYPGIIIAILIFGGLALYSYKKVKDYDKI